MSDNASRKTENKPQRVCCEENDYRGMSVGEWLLHVVHGALVGLGAILPGISGGVLMVVFGIYRPVMALLSHPIKAFKKYFRLLIPVLIGWAVGFIGLAKLVDMLFKAQERFAICLFIGLIAGTLPMLFRQAGREGRKAGSWLTLAGCFAFLLALLYVLGNVTGVSIQPNLWWFLLCGVVWGVSIIVPGMSSSSILIFLGLYEPMTEGIGNLNFAVIAAVIVGAAASALLLARFVNGLYEKHYSIVSRAVLGFVLASTVAIIPLQYTGWTEGLICLALAAAGFFIAWLMDKVNEKFRQAGKKK